MHIQALKDHGHGLHAYTLSAVYERLKRLKPTKEKL
jgi:hypothetical protein